jgi:hypothetical protein
LALEAAAKRRDGSGNGGRYGVFVSEQERRVIQFDDSEGHQLHAVWSRSGKRLIVSVADGPGWDSAGRVELTPEQVDALRRFLSETVAEPPGKR